MKDYMEKQGFVYILANRKQGTLYTGVTSELTKRLHQHRTEITGGFTAEYDVKRLMWFEVHAAIEAAILREKQIKKWRRAWKIELIEADNPDWNDLAVSLLGFDTLSRHSRERGNPSPAFADRGPFLDNAGDGFPRSRE